MAFTVIAAGDIDAKSPVQDDLMTDLKENDDWLMSAITDGASASQGLTVSTVTVKASGTALTVDNNAQFTGNVNIDGTLTADVFNSSEELLFLYW